MSWWKRGELKAEEAGQFVDELMQQAQQQTPTPDADESGREPRRIEIITDEAETGPGINQPRSQTHQQRPHRLPPTMWSSCDRKSKPSKPVYESYSSNPWQSFLSILLTRCAGPHL